MPIKKETPLAENVSKEMVAQPTDNFNLQEIITKAATQNASVETMERLLALAEKMQAIRAKQEFDKAMANFQANCPVIEKRKRVSFGTTNYSYAPLDDIVDQVKDLLSTNGFSYTFDTTQTENMMTIICKAKHILGHSETSKCDIGIDTASKMNKSQQYGAAMTYGKRYAFCNAFGILTGDEDTDANEPRDTERKPKTWNNFGTPIQKLQPKQEELPTIQQEEIDPFTLDLELRAKIQNGKDITELGVIANEITQIMKKKVLTKEQISDLKELYKIRYAEVIKNK